MSRVPKGCLHHLSCGLLKFLLESFITPAAAGDGGNIMFSLSRIPEVLKRSVKLTNFIVGIGLFGIWQWISHCSRGLFTNEGVYFVMGLMFSTIVVSAITWRIFAKIIVVSGVIALGCTVYDGDAAQRLSEYLYYSTSPQAIDIMIVGGEPDEVNMPEFGDIRSEFLICRSFILDGARFYAVIFVLFNILQIAFFVWKRSREKDEIPYGWEEVADKEAWPHAAHA
ncbi:MAG: hypothetical protein IT292_00720 [Deltaproteobacteria bacterium]|nr:hypothetical protein [Deltaproteobacteria bacterium]